MNKKPRATREKKEYRMLRKGETIRPTDEVKPWGAKKWEAAGFLIPGAPMLMPNYDPETMNPFRREVKTAKRSAQAKPKPSQSHPQPRRPKK